ncbi:MAG: tyrosine-type recombinase/integrase [Chloroflexota bacterium]|nr:tyrosine-type recombinase/integrase [Chloroflexota bacterium]
MFDRGDGRLIHVDAPGDALDRLAERRSLPRMRFHDLRHTMATVGLVEGVHPKVIQERLGHSSIAMTLDRYSHVSAELQRAGAEQLDAALGRSRQTGRDQAVTKP